MGDSNFIDIEPILSQLSAELNLLQYRFCSPQNIYIALVYIQIVCGVWGSIGILDLLFAGHHIKVVNKSLDTWMIINFRKLEFLDALRPKILAQLRRPNFTYTEGLVKVRLYLSALWGFEKMWWEQPNPLLAHNIFVDALVETHAILLICSEFRDFVPNSGTMGKTSRKRPEIRDIFHLFSFSFLSMGCVLYSHGH